jgi:integron integrase
MKLLERFDATIERMHYADSTGEVYRRWIFEYLVYCKGDGDWKHPSQLNENHLEEWLTHLAVDGDVSASTQTQALSAILFLYKHVLGTPLQPVDAMRAKRSQYIPVVLSADEALSLIDKLKNPAKLIAMLMFGCGMRINEAASLRVKDLDFANRIIVIKSAKGAKDRTIAMPESLVDRLEKQVEQAKRWQRWDTDENIGGVPLPYAYGRKSPKSHHDYRWYWLFCSSELSREPKTGKLRRWHLDKDNIGRSISAAAKRAGITKKVSSHTLRHTFATCQLNMGTDIRTIQKMLGHADVRTTMIYTHCDAGGHQACVSPLDWALSGGRQALPQNRQSLRLACG